MAGYSRNIFETLCVAAAIAAAGLSVGRLHAQSANDEATITGFSLPEVDEAGQLKWKVLGDQAKFKPAGPMDITGLRVEWFKSNRVDMVMTSPQCLYHREQREAQTDAPVQIRGQNLLITGNGFYWSGTNNLLVIRNDAHVYVSNAKSFVNPQTNNATASPSPEENHK